MTKKEHKRTIFDGILAQQQLQFKILRKKSNMAKSHWSEESNIDLLGELEQKFNELWDLSEASRDRKQQKKLCAHIANFTMMVLDNLKR